MELEYIIRTECTFISDEYVIFNITIKRNCFDEDGQNVVYEGNIIIDEQFNVNSDGNTIVKEFDNQMLIKEKVEESIGQCIERAKWVFR